MAAAVASTTAATSGTLCLSLCERTRVCTKYFEYCLSLRSVREAVAERNAQVGP